MRKKTRGKNECFVLSHLKPKLLIDIRAAGDAAALRLLPQQVM